MLTRRRCDDLHLDDPALLVGVRSTRSLGCTDGSLLCRPLIQELGPGVCQFPFALSLLTSLEDVLGMLGG